MKTIPIEMQAEAVGGTARRPRELFRSVSRRSGTKMLEAGLEKNGGCPVPHGAPRGTHMDPGMMTNRDWWPNQLNLKVLHQNSALCDPMGPAVRYSEEFQ